MILTVVIQKKRKARGKSKAVHITELFAAKGVHLVGGNVVFGEAGVISQAAAITSEMRVDVTRL